MNHYLLVMAGGQGTRFWPESTSKRPKQYLKLISEKSLLSETLERFDGLVNPANRFIITVKNQESLAKIAATNLTGDRGIIFEPTGRNTAPCILLAIADLVSRGANLDDVVAIVPSDHVILNKGGFQKVISKAFKLAVAEKKIVTIGIPPTFPHTGFGYIEKDRAEQKDFYGVKGFKEKPSFEKATEYLKSGNYFWNAGMFVATLKTLLEEFETHAPEIAKFYNELKEAAGDFNRVSSIYSQIPSNSIDYAVMEKSKRVLVVPAEFDWNDLGSWDALESVILQKDENTLLFEKGHFFDNAKGNIVFAPGKFVSLIDVQDLIIVSNDKAILVLPKNNAQKVKRVVDHLQKNHLGSDLL